MTYYNILGHFALGPTHLLLHCMFSSGPSLQLQLRLGHGCRQLWRHSQAPPSV